MNPESLREAFAARFGRPCAVVSRAPGRVNLIGEHTDYNDGYVLPIATQHSTWVAVAGGKSGQVRCQSANLDESAEWPLRGWRDAAYPHWTGYVAGVAALLSDRGLPLNGIDILIHSEVPVGSGLSSSAALTVAVAKALTSLGGHELSIKDLAAVSRAAENQFAGVPCGVMDQYASLACQPDAALLLDCRSLEYEVVPLSLGEHVFVVVDSGVRHELAAGEYAKRQAQCREALAYFQQSDPAVRALRDVDLATVQAHRSNMPKVPAARAMHVTSENARTLAAAASLRRGALEEMGQLMLASHRSLREDYEVSCGELDLLVKIVSHVPGVLGARMTGGGFGGCMVALAHQNCIDRIGRELRERYDTPQRQARPFAVHRPGAGAKVEYP